VATVRIIVPSWSGGPVSPEVNVVKYRLVLLGAANPETQRMLIDAERHQCLLPHAFIDNDSSKWGTEFCGLPVVGGIASVDAINAPDVRYVNLITRDTRTRYLTTHEMVKRGCRFTNLIHSQIDLTGVTIGTGNYLQSGVMVQAAATIGDNVSFHVGSIIAHEARIGNSVFIAHGVCVSGSVEIGDGVFIGANATLLPRIRIGAWATVGAGAVVLSDVPDGATVVGNPARVVREAPVPFTTHERLLG
jgi:sugar O-acyltransferase (sialic acid O-acetyltransferase NeuD family)